MIRRPYACLAVLILSLCIQTARSESPDEPVLVKISESELYSSYSRFTATDCMRIEPNGRFHLERRFQQLPNEYSTLRIYEDMLSGPELEKLLDILNDPHIRELPPFSPVTSKASHDAVQGFEATISRDGVVRAAGYMLWRSQGPLTENPAQPFSGAESQRAAREALQPLLDWFHAVEAAPGQQVANSRSTLCEVGPD